jgi:hypothetical protein
MEKPTGNLILQHYHLLIRVFIAMKGLSIQAKKGREYSRRPGDEILRINALRKEVAANWNTTSSLH